MKMASAGSICRALSADADNWTQLTEPIIEPGEDETPALCDPALPGVESKNNGK